MCILLTYTWWFRFGSVRFRFLVFGIGPVRFLFGFGSCGSWSISVRFGSVFGTFCIDICFFSGVGKANTDCFPQEVYSSGLSRCFWPHWLFKFWEFQLPLRKLNVCLVQRAGPLGTGVRDSVPKEEHRLYMAMQISLEESRAVRFTSSGFQRAERAELGKTKAS